MSKDIDVFWTLPTRGDGSSGTRTRWNRGEWNPRHVTRFARSVRDERPGRFTYADYAVQVARGADLAGFRGLFAPYDPAGDDAWILSSALARETKHLTIVPEFPPGFASAVYTAKLAFTFQRFFNNRLGWKLALDEPPGSPPAERLARAEELLIVAEGVWGETPFDFNGRFFSVEGGALFALHSGQHVRVAARRFPTVFASGEADDVLAFSAAHADVHLFDTLDHAVLTELIARHRALSAQAGRAARYGLRLAVVAREYESDALTAGGRLWEGSEPDAGDDGTWRGFTRAGHAFDGGLIGTYEDVADRLAAYAELGITTFVLDALPRLEEAYRLGEQLLPLLALRSREAVR